MLRFLNNLIDFFFPKKESQEEQKECKISIGVFKCDRPRGHSGWHRNEEASITWGDAWKLGE